MRTNKDIWELLNKAKWELLQNNITNISAIVLIVPVWNKTNFLDSAEETKKQMQRLISKFRFTPKELTLISFKTLCLT